MCQPQEAGTKCCHHISQPETEEARGCTSDPFLPPELPMWPPSTLPTLQAPEFHAQANPPPLRGLGAQTGLLVLRGSGNRHQQGDHRL